jgi:hypothetical protein
MEFVDTVEAFRLKRRVADRQHLIQQQNVRFQVCGNRKPQPKIHAG